MQLMDDITVDENFVSTMGMTITAGRDFSTAFRGDINHSVLINETAVDRYGWENPIGKTIQVMDRREENNIGSRTVIGVFKDFHIRGISRSINPMIVNWDPAFPFNYGKYWFFLLRIRPDRVEKTVHDIEATWKKLNPDKALNSFFISDMYNRQFRRTERSRNIFSYFTFLAIFIACLGLLGMASFTAQKRSKEIGIRKVMGASVRGIVLLLSKELLFLVAAANLIAWPAAYLWTRNWLADFPYRIGLSFSAFIIAGILVLVISFMTISYQAVRAATTSPVHTLKYE
jgi:putative ABC transport system permease protein